MYLEIDIERIYFIDKINVFICNVKTDLACK